MAKKIVKKENLNSNTNDSKLFAFLATFFSVIGFLIALIAKKNDEYVMFYAKQSLVIFICSVIAQIISFIPLFGWIVGPIAYVLVIIVWLISWIYALSGEMKEVPVVGKFADKFNF